MPHLFARPDAVEVAQGLLLGSAPGKRQRRALVRAGVTWVIDLREEGPRGAREWPDGVGVILAPVEDRKAHDLGTLTEVGSLIADLTGRGERVLVHCHAGIGRAATVACAALMQRGMPLAEAFSLIRQKRVGAAPTERQVRMLEELEGALAARRQAAKAGE